MWWNSMPFVGEEGVRVADLEKLAVTKTNLNGMERWGYVTVAPDPVDPATQPPKPAGLVRATAKGCDAEAARRWLGTNLWELDNLSPRQILARAGQAVVPGPECGQIA
jgi:hypothetical protein